jgi:hypothetical protein
MKTHLIIDRLKKLDSYANGNCLAPDLGNSRILEIAATRLESLKKENTKLKKLTGQYSELTQDSEELKSFCGIKFLENKSLDDFKFIIK